LTTHHDAPDAFAPARLGPVRLRNRILKAATFEGMTGGQTVSDALVDFHRVVARGGVGMSTLAFCAVSPDGAATPNELVLRDDSVPGLARLADAVHAEGAAVSAQIGHAGAVAASTGVRGVAPSRIWSPLAMKRMREATAADLARIREDFAAGARRLEAAGFDAVEVHLGHGYLLSEFLSPAWNFRDDEYGGSRDNRARLLCEVIGAAKARAGADFPIWARLDCREFRTPGGTQPEHCARTAELAAEVLHALPPDRVLDLVGLLDGVGRDRGEVLLEVPRAAVAGVAQAAHDLQETLHACHARTIARSCAGRCASATTPATWCRFPRGTASRCPSFLSCTGSSAPRAWWTQTRSTDPSLRPGPT